MADTAESLAELLDLTPHPAGCTGWFRQTYGDTTNVDTKQGQRAASTAIYFLQKMGMRSAFHRQRSAEVGGILGSSEVVTIASIFAQGVPPLPRGSPGAVLAD